MSVDPAVKLRLARKARVRFDPRHQKHMLLYPERGLLLNEVGARIALACDGSRAWSAVLDELSSAFPAVAPDVLARDAESFVEKLRARGLLEEVP